jgi:SHS2 domain-containing protein
VRYALPQPYEDLGHTADVGVRVRGATAEEALARLVLAFASVASGGAPPGPAREERIEIAGGPDLAGSAVALLRELLYRLATEGVVPTWCEVVRVDAGGADARVGLAARDPDAGGADVKAVTWHAARLDREGDGWIAQAVLDI